MFVRCFQVALLLLVMFCVTSQLGCARLANKRNCRPCSANTCAAPAPKEALPVIAFEDRNPIILSDVTHPVEGIPLAANPAEQPLEAPFVPDRLRDLTRQETERLAHKAAPIAQRLESHRDWLATLERTPPAILDAMTHQARYERSKHQQLATEAYLNLTKVYTKSPIVNRTDEVLVESETALAKFREAGVEVPGDPQELHRQRIKLTEQYVEIRHNQLRLVDGLETLLNLNHEPTQPIWTNYQASDRGAVPAEAEAISLALSQRGDLLALERLASESQTLSVDFLRGSEMGNPLMGAGFELPGPAKWWQCLLKDEIACLKQSAQGERQRQLLLLAENKRDQIRLEVRQTLHAIEKHQGNLKLKLQRIDHLRNAMQAAEQAKDIRPLDFQTRLEQRTEELALISEIIDELIALDIERDKLDHFMGKE